VCKTGEQKQKKGPDKIFPIIGNHIVEYQSEGKYIVHRNTRSSGTRIPEAQGPGYRKLRDLGIKEVGTENLG